MENKDIIGKKIRIINMRGEPDYAGKEGVITHIDALGYIHGTWDGLSIIPDQDIYEFVGGNTNEEV